MKNDPRSFNEITKNIEYKCLRLKAVKAIVPISCLHRILPKISIIRLELNSRAHTGKISSNLVRGIKMSLNESNLNNIVDKHNLYTLEDYTNLQYIQDELKDKIKLSKLFRDHMSRCEDESIYKLRIESFFKYMPFLKPLHYDLHKLDNGYCCEDHDGPYSEWTKNNINSNINTISSKLDELKII